MTRTAEQVYAEHVAALAAHDADLVVEHYATDAVLASNTGIGSGHDHIRGVFEAFFAHGPAIDPVTTVRAHGDVVYVTWRADGAGGELTGSDTFVVHDGLITVHTGFIAQG